LPRDLREGFAAKHNTSPKVRVRKAYGVSNLFIRMGTKRSELMGSIALQFHIRQEMHQRVQ